MLANYRVPAELSAIETTEDGRAVVIATVDGCLTVLAIADRSFGFSPDSLVHVYYIQLTGSRRFYHAEYMSVERCDRNVRKTYAIRTGRGTWVENVVARLTA